MAVQWKDAIQAYRIESMLPTAKSAIQKLLTQAIEKHGCRTSEFPDVKNIQGTFILEGINLKKERVPNAALWTPQGIPMRGHFLDVSIQLEFKPNRSVIMDVFPDMGRFGGRCNRSPDTVRIIYPGEVSVEIGILEDDIIEVPKISFYHHASPNCAYGFRSEICESLIAALKKVEA